MWAFIIIVAVIWFGFFMWAVVDSRKRRKKHSHDAEKPFCRSEESLEEYGKKMGEPTCPEPEE